VNSGKQEWRNKPAKSNTSTPPQQEIRLVMNALLRVLALQEIIKHPHGEKLRPELQELYDDSMFTIIEYYNNNMWSTEEHELDAF